MPFPEERDYIENADCIAGMKAMLDQSVDFTLTDIPYGEVSRRSGGLRVLDKGNADKVTFPVRDFLEEACRVTKNALCVFCGKEQFSEIFAFFASKDGTVRPIVWEKTNPSPMNGQYVYVSGIELAVWFKRKGAKTFNAFCKNTVFRYPNGTRKIHPTQKNPDLFAELVRDNTRDGDIVFDPCMGSGTTAIAAMRTGRHFYGFEKDKGFHGAAMERIREFAAKNECGLEAFFKAAFCGKRMGRM